MFPFATRTLPRRPAAALAGVVAVVGSALVLPASAHENGHDTGSGHASGAGHVSGPALVFRSPLSDLQFATTQPLEGAHATLRLTVGRTKSAYVLTVVGIARSAAGTTYGAHLHSGSCVPGDGAAAGPHYNSASPPVVDASHEVWLDFTVNRSGGGRATAIVPFVPVHGARAVVIHEMATNHDTGAAGARLACMPVVW